jgi:hypothetical protein
MTASASIDCSGGIPVLIVTGTLAGPVSEVVSSPTEDLSFVNGSPGTWTMSEPDFDTTYTVTEVRGNRPFIDSVVITTPSAPACAPPTSAPGATPSGTITTPGAVTPADIAPAQTAPTQTTPTQTAPTGSIKRDLPATGLGTVAVALAASGWCLLVVGLVAFRFSRRHAS